METTVMHRFNQPGVFAVSVECSTSDWHVTADSVITIQEPVGEFGAISCFSGNTSTDGTKCNALSDQPAMIQVVVERGEPVTHNPLLKRRQRARRRFVCCRNKCVLCNSQRRPFGRQLLRGQGAHSSQPDASRQCDWAAGSRLPQLDPECL